jgi:hypothetical protein
LIFRRKRNKRELKKKRRKKKAEKVEEEEGEEEEAKEEEKKKRENTYIYFVSMQKIVALNIKRFLIPIDKEKKRRPNHRTIVHNIFFFHLFEHTLKKMRQCKSVEARAAC